MLFFSSCRSVSELFWNFWLSVREIAFNALRVGVFDQYFCARDAASPLIRTHNWCGLVYACTIRLCFWAQNSQHELRYKQMLTVVILFRRLKRSECRVDSVAIALSLPLFLSQRCVSPSCHTQLNYSLPGLKGKLFGGVKVKRARSFSGREKQKWSATKDVKDGEWDGFGIGSLQFNRS